MKTTTDLVHENVENLKSLWRIVGEQAGVHTSAEDFEFGVINDSDWPNRLWFHQDVDEASVKAAKDQLLSASTKLVVPYWDIYRSRSYELLEANDFEKIFEQVGMALELEQTYEESGELTLKRVDDATAALLWEQLFKQAFGYTINHKLLLPTYDDISFLIAYHNNDPAGTAILHNTGNTIMGIHAMGIIPEMRRKGLAEQMMRKILNQSVEQGFEYATLQASDMGKGLYLKLGFEERFIMKNYILK